jgi:dTDP-4-dehydrorhamnose reductase
MKILITGSHGQLGSDCAGLLSHRHDVFAPDEKDLDIVNLDTVLYIVSGFSPDILLNCAAFTNVDACETEREQAWRVNVDGPENLAVAAKEYGVKLIHVSTDYVFNGKKKVPEPYVEDDETAPLSYYGSTKLESEHAVQRENDNHIIIRTSWVYGMNGHNFLKTMLRLALTNSKQEIKVVNDQFGSPTWAYSLAQQIEKLMEDDRRGIYHASAEGYCTWFELASYFLEKMGVENPVVPCMTKDYPTPAVRPMNSILENRRLKNEEISVLPFWRDGLDKFVDKFRERLIHEARWAVQ